MELGLKVRPTTTVDRPNLGLMVSLLLNLNKEEYHRNNTYEESKRCKKDRLTGVPSLIYRACMVIEKENKLLYYYYIVQHPFFIYTENYPQ